MSSKLVVQPLALPMFPVLLSSMPCHTMSCYAMVHTHWLILQQFAMLSLTHRSALLHTTTSSISSSLSTAMPFSCCTKLCRNALLPSCALLCHTAPCHAPVNVYCLCRFTLCCAVLRCALLRCAVLCCAMSYFARAGSVAAALTQAAHLA